MKTCDMPTGPESKRCGKVAVADLVWDSKAEDARPDLHSCLEHLPPMAAVCAHNEGAPRRVVEVPPYSDVEVLRWVLSR